MKTNSLALILTGLALFGNAARAQDQSPTGRPVASSWSLYDAVKSFDKGQTVTREALLGRWRLVGVSKEDGESWFRSSGVGWDSLEKGDRELVIGPCENPFCDAIATANWDGSTRIGNNVKIVKLDKARIDEAHWEDAGARNRCRFVNAETLVNTDALLCRHSSVNDLGGESSLRYFGLFRVAAAPGLVQYWVLYSRPNDDSFQNELGNAGEPFEVALLRVALVSQPGSKPQTVALGLDWSATITTGWHVEAGLAFELVEKTSNLGVGQGRQRLGVRYAEGADANSVEEKKKGSVLFAGIPLGEASDGEYSGVVEVRKRGARDDERGVLDGAHNRATGAVFQSVEWRAKIARGRLVERDIVVRRFKEPQVRLIDSNFKEIDKSKREHQNYPKKPKGAEKAPEKVGDGK